MPQMGLQVMEDHDPSGQREMLSFLLVGQINKT